MDEKPTSGGETSKNIEEEKTTERQRLEDDNDAVTKDVEEDMMEIDSERTETLSCPSQKLWFSSQESENNEEKIKENNPKIYHEDSEVSKQKETEKNPKKLKKILKTLKRRKLKQTKKKLMKVKKWQENNRKNPKKMKMKIVK